MNYIDAVISMIPNEPNSNIGIYSENSELIEAVERKADEFLSTTYDLRENNFRRLPFGGEFFEFIVFDSDKMVLDEQVAKQLEFAIQKNRFLAVLTSSLKTEDLENIYTELNFTHIEPIDFEDKRIFSMRKWFRL